jgi:large subunit ribosomal protein L35
VFQIFQFGRASTKMGNKQKTRKAASKRVSVTGSGKLRRRKVGLCHLQTRRAPGTQMRNNDGAMAVSESNTKQVRRMLAI